VPAVATAPGAVARLTARPWVLPAAGAILLFLIASFAGNGGLATAKFHGDVAHYQTFAARLRAGDFPYSHGFYIEYPPFALPVFVLPDYASHAHYLLAFKALMALCGVLLILAVARTMAAIGFEQRRMSLLLGIVALLPLVQGATVLNRYDLWPALLTATALMLYVLDRDRPASVFLALSFAAKIYSLALVPVVAIWLWRRGGLARLRRSTVAYVVTCAIVFAPFVVRSLHGLAYSYYTQLRRGLQIESTGASVLLVAHKLGLYDYHWVYGLSTDLAGRLPDVVGGLTTVVEVGAILWAAWLYYRSRSLDPAAFATAAAATVAAFVAFGKVLSPQYVTWVVAIVPLATRALSVRLGVLLLAVMALTQAELVWGDWGIRNGNWTVWLLFARNVGLLAIAFLTIRALGRRPVDPDATLDA
jgi:uncharacterized membrane protein